MQIHITNSASYPEAEPLQCPTCRTGCLHQYVVATYFGSDEDSSELRLTEVSQGDTTVTEALRDDQQHGRRDACFIHFWCENCSRNPVLRIIQHKGSTFLEWLPERFDRRRAG